MSGTLWLHDLADAARSSGLEVIEVDGWRTRSAAPHGGRYGGPGLDYLGGILVHHTATPETYHPERDYPTYAVILRGNGSTPGPLSQLGLCRCGRHVYVFAAGICWHAGAVRDYATQGNRVALGIEAEHSGLAKDMPWPAARYAGYVALVAALAAWYDVPTSRVRGHKEASTTGKIDPLFHMGTFRAHVDEGRRRLGTGTAGPVAIEQLQQLLNQFGAALVVDGRYGRLTLAACTAVAAFTDYPGDVEDVATLTDHLEDEMSKLDDVHRWSGAQGKKLDDQGEDLREALARLARLGRC